MREMQQQKNPITKTKRGVIAEVSYHWVRLIRVQAAERVGESSRRKERRGQLRRHSKHYY